ncbi:Major facilitator superfamily, partial [Globisporangium splendens]
MEKSQKRVRWVVLVLSCVLMVGNYYCFDNPAALKSQLQQHFSQFPKERYEFLFNLLYTLYSIPNILLPFFGGVLVDRFGARVMLVTFSIAILVGQIIFAIGCSTYNFNIMLIGRTVFGFGGESLGVAQGTLVASWFKNSELGKNGFKLKCKRDVSCFCMILNATLFGQCAAALALGINLSVARLGSVINNELSPAIAHASSVSAALWVGVVMCIVSFLAVLVVIPIDKRDERTAQALRQGVKSTAVTQSISFGDIRHFRPAFWLLALSCVVVYGCVIPFNNVASSLLMERDFFKEPPSACVRCGEGAYSDDFICPTIAPECPPVPPYSWPLPKLSANCTIKDPVDQWNCTTTPPLIDESKINCDDDAWKHGPLTKIYCAKKAEAAEKAATPMSIPYIISAVISPFLGFMVDRIGLRAVLALVAPISLTLVHAMLGLTNVSLYIPLVLQGISYSVFAAALWPSVPCVEMLFVTFGVLGSIVGVLLNILDYQNGSVLNRSHQSKKTTLFLDDETTDTESLLSSEY